MTKSQTAVAITAGVVLLGVIYYVLKNGLAGLAKGTVTAADNLVGGAVVGVGDAIGIPETNMGECQALLAAGKYWDASFKCPAGVLIKGLFGDTPADIPPASSPATPASTGSALPGVAAAAPDLSFAEP